MVWREDFDDFAVMNTLFKKWNEHIITYKCGRKISQIDYLLIKSKYYKNISTIEYPLKIF